MLESHTKVEKRNKNNAETFFGFSSLVSSNILTPLSWTQINGTKVYIVLVSLPIVLFVYHMSKIIHLPDRMDIIWSGCD